MFKQLFTWAFLAMTAFWSQNVTAQSYVINNSAIDAGNPGGVRTISDLTGSSESVLLDAADGGGTSTNAWSQTSSIPFAFNFNGSAVTHFIVTKNGLLSFDTTNVGMATSAGQDVNVALPSTDLPNNTVAAFWEDFPTTALGSNDDVWVGEFGTAPNRQLWIRWHSMRLGASTFSYFAIVLEQGTDKIYVVDMSYANSPGTITGTVGIQVNSTTAYDVITPLNGTMGSPNIAMGTGSTPASDNEFYEFEFFAAGACVPPTALSATATGATSGTVSWTSGGAANALVEYGPTGFALGSGTQVYVTGATSTPISGLTAQTTYDVYVKDSCASSASPFTGPVSFTTPCSSTLSGTYTINSTVVTGGTNFASFADAATELNACGVSGAVTFNIAAGTYNDSLVLTSIPGASATNTITFDGGDTATTTLTHSSTNDIPTVYLNGADHVTISNLTISNTSSSDAWGVMLQGVADSNTITNCHIKMPVGTTSDVIGIVASDALSFETSTGNNANGTMISNNLISGGETGIHLTGGSLSADYNSGNMIMNNLIINTDDHGIEVDGQVSLTVSGNTITDLQSAFADAVYLIDIDDYTVSGNTIVSPDWGLYINDGNDGFTPTANSMIVNNMVASSSDYGIYLNDFEHTTIIHNNVLGEPGLYLNDQDNSVIIKNNILSSTSDYAFEMVDTLTGNEVINYNLYFTGGTDLVEILSTVYTDLAAWIASDASRNANSLEGDPVFLSSTDLHVLGTLANNAGEPLGVTVDIDGESRNTTTPDIGADEYAPASCFPPSMLGATNITATSADVYWTTGGAANWNVEYGASGFTPGTGTIIAATNDTVSISGLTPQTDYEFYVQDSCGAGNVSPFAGPQGFQTACSAVSTFPFLEDFETSGSSIPACWVNDQADDADWIFRSGSIGHGATTDNTLGTSAGFYAGMDDSDASNDDTINNLLTPLFDLTSLSVPQLQFFYFIGNDNVLTSKLVIDVFDGTTWNMDVATFTDSSATWIQAQVDLTPYSSASSQIRFRGIETIDFNSDLSIDDVTVRETPSCAVPTALGSTNITDVSADVYWTTGGAMNWNVEYGPAGFTPGTGTIVAATNDTLTISSLMSGTTYDFYVQDSCGAGDVSAFVGPSSFTTNLCPPANQCTFPVTLHDSFGDGWNGSEVTVYQGGVAVAVLGTGFTGSTGSPAGDTLQTSVSLCDSVDAYFVVTTGANGFPNYASEIGLDVLAPFGVNVLSFDNNAATAQGDTLGFFQAICTAPSCLAPTNVTIVSSTDTSVTVTWTAGGATNWNVQYGAAGFALGTGTVATSTNDTVTITGLMAATAYDFYVQDSCGAGNVSAYVGPATGATQACAATNQCSFTFGLDDSFGDGWNGTELTIYQNNVPVATIGSSFTGGSTDSALASLCDGVMTYAVLSTGGAGIPFYTEETSFDVYDPFGVLAATYAASATSVQGDTLASFMASCAAAACLAPTGFGVDTVTTTSATVYWAADANYAGGYLEFGPVGFTPGTGTIVSTTNDTTTFSGLMANTCYDVYLTDSCTNGALSSTAGPFAVCAACATVTAPFFEGFETLGANIPNCWSSFSTSGETWRFTSSNIGHSASVAATGTFFAAFDDSENPSTTDGVLETPVIDVSGLTTPTLSFNLWSDAEDGSGVTAGGVLNATIDIAVLNASGNWDTVFTNTGNTAGWEFFFVDMTTVTLGTTTQVRFVIDEDHDSGFDDDISIDDISIDNRTPCFDPLNLMTTNIGLTSVSLTWDSDTTVNSSIIEYGIQGFVLGSGTQLATSAGAGTVPGLTSATCYDFYVLDSCSGGFTSWLGPITVCTSAPCVVSTSPTGVNDSTGCGGGFVALSATAGNSNSDVAWIFNGDVIAVSDTITDTIAGTTSYDAHDYNVTGPRSHVGPLPSIATAGFGNFTNGQFITVLDTIYIDSMLVRSNGFVNAQTVIRDATGTDIIQRGTVFETPATGTVNTQVPVDVLLVPGNYFIGIDFDITAVSTGQLFRATGGAVYPYIAPGLLSITSDNFNGSRYYYTFDLVVRGACLGTPTPVIGFVPGASAGLDASVNICESNNAYDLTTAIGPYTKGGTWTDITPTATGALTDSIFDATVTGAGGPFTFQYVVSGAGGCAADTSIVIVQADTLISAGTSGTGAFCTDDTRFVSILPLLVGADGGGTFTDLDASGILIAGRIRPNQGTPGTYRYSYVTPSNGSCPGDSSVVTITLSDPVDAGADVSDTTCLNAGTTDLSTLLSAGASTGGTWIDVDGSGGLSGSTFDPSGVVPNTVYNFRYLVTGGAGCDDDSATVSMFVCDDVSNPEYALRNVALYPNPTNGVFYVENGNEGFTTTVMTLDGKVLQEQSFEGNEAHKMDISKFPAGVYNVKVNANNSFKVFRVIVQH